MKKILIAVFAFFLLVPNTAYSQESTLKMIDHEMFPREKVVVCESCGVKNSSFSRFCAACGAPLSQEELNAFFMIKTGSFIPGDSAMRDAYGTPLSIGFALNLEHKNIGVRFEVDNYWMERLTPVTSSVTTATAPIEGEWMNASLRYLYTPVTLSVYYTENLYSWKGYFGAGAGICMIRQETKGSYYVSSALKWGYADVIENENLPCYQIFAGVVKNNKIGLEVKYSFIPSMSRFPYPYIGGLSTSVGILF